MLRLALFVLGLFSLLWVVGNFPHQSRQIGRGIGRGAEVFGFNPDPMSWVIAIAVGIFALWVLSLMFKAFMGNVRSATDFSKKKEEKKH